MSVNVTPAPAGKPGEPDQFYIRTESSLADEQHLVLKQGETFVVLDRFGEIRPVGLAEEGLYHDGTRYLSRLLLRIAGERAMLLSSGVSHDNSRIVVNLTNLDMTNDGCTIARGTIHVLRVLTIWNGVLHERLRFTNYGDTAVTLPLTIGFSADFADIFEVRGTARERRGARLPSETRDRTMTMSYRGLDDVVRRTRVSFSRQPAGFAGSEARFDLRVEPGADAVLDLAAACEREPERPPIVAFSTALDASVDALAARRSDACRIDTSNGRFNEGLARSLADLAMMTTDTPHGRIPYAGVPWFSAPFGRDSLITALECLWAMPEMARGVLCYLAATQATSRDPDRDAQPGKILHEARHGEMAALGEIPFGRYYGSQDATPLFVMLAAAYDERADDLPFIRELWPHIEAALDWIDRDGDLDGDGFVEYARQSSTGLVNQGWKDSSDAIFHASGELATSPIALCEIQGYVYAAWAGAAKLATRLGRPAVAAEFAARAETVRSRFEDAFWLPALGTYALALDGDKRPCEIVTSNAAHALYAGIASADRARRVAETLVNPRNFSGWGVRTVAAGSARYNPMSYHNGSVWPHDNALAAAGFARYGFPREVLAVMEGLFEASVHFDLHRLPELFCGFERRPGEAPVPYPVACSPQSWASASTFLLLQASLGLRVDAAARTIEIANPRLPRFLTRVSIERLRVGSGSADLEFSRHGDRIRVTSACRDGHVTVSVRQASSAPPRPRRRRATDAR